MREKAMRLFRRIIVKFLVVFINHSGELIIFHTAMYTGPIHQQPIVTAIIMQTVEIMKITHDFAFSCYE